MASALQLQAESTSSGPLQSVLILTAESAIAEELASYLAGGLIPEVDWRTETSEAIDFCRHSRPNVAVIDIEQRVNDRSVAEILADDFQTAVVVVGPAESTEHLQTANAVGALAYLVQPVSATQLQATIHIAWSRHVALAALCSEVDSLRQRLVDRKIIEQAKWVLVQRLNISEPDAMRLLQRHARNNRRPIVTIATSIVEMKDLFDFNALAG